MPYDPATNPLNSKEWVFPVLEVFHISCFAASIGLISIVNLRLWGSAFSGTTAKDLNRQLFLWTLAGLTIVLLAGMAAAMNYLPHSQIMFGTDFPYVTVESNAQQLHDRHLSKAEMAAIQRGNVLRLMPQLA